MSEYIGNRIVPRHDGVWDKAKEYEPLTIVYEESTGDSYMSRKPVPAGTLLSQEEYWAMCSRFSEQMALYRQNTAEEVEQFRKDTAADVEQLRTDTASDVAVLRKMTAQDVADITQKVDAANSAVAASKSEMDKTAEMLKAQINANVKASTDKNANYAQELVDARVDDEGKTYPTAGDNIRAVGRVRSMQNIMKNWVIKNGYANQNGNLVASESWRVAHMVPVSGDAILVDGQFGYMSGRDDYNNVVCYDMDRKFLGGCFRAESGKVYDNYVITLLPNTRFISVTTNEKLFSKLSVYLYDNMLPMRLLSNYATGWQWMNGSVDIRFTGSKVTVTFPEGKSVYVCRRTNGTQYEQTKLVAENSTSFDFAVVGKWWAIYYDGAEASANETGEKTEVPVIKVENTSGDSWGDLFTKGRFVFAVFFDWNVVYAAPSSSGTVINGIDYGNPAKIANTAMTWHKYRSAKMFLATGQFAIDTVNRTIQVTKRILAVVDNDCVIHPLGTRGPEGGKHEGRGSWTFARYLADTDYAGKTNAFWDKIKGRLDFQKYCETNGYEGIDYFLIALGTNDVSQGTTLYRTEAEVQKFVDQAKQFIDALLDKETGFPNCKIGIGLCGPGSDYSFQCGSSMGIFHMSINTLNLALIKAFDAGKYHKNVTCFAHGLRTDRRLAFPYSDKPVTNRFTEMSRTLTNSIHPSARGYQAWADGYYCQIRAWLTEDSK